MPTSKQRSGKASANGASPVGPSIAAVIATTSARSRPSSSIVSANTAVQPDGVGPDRAGRCRGRTRPGSASGRRRRSRRAGTRGPCAVTACTITGPPKSRARRSARLHGRDVVAVDRPEVLQAEVGEQLLRAQRVLHPGLDRVQRRVQRAADHRGALQRLLAVLQHPLVAGLQAQRRRAGRRQPADRRRVGAAVVVDDDDDGGGRAPAAMLLSASQAMPPVSAPSPITATTCGRCPVSASASREAVGPGQRRWRRGCSRRGRARSRRGSGSPTSPPVCFSRSQPSCRPVSILCT